MHQESQRKVEEKVPQHARGPADDDDHDDYDDHDDHVTMILASQDALEVMRVTHSLTESLSNH